MAGGRPRTISPEPEELENLGREMLKFVMEDKYNILHISEWYRLVKGFTYNQWKTIIQKEEFLPYYEQSLAIIGKKYLDKNSSVRDNISPRWQRIYFRDLKEEENEKALFDSQLKQAEFEKIAKYEYVTNYDTSAQQIPSTPVPNGDSTSAK